MPPNEGGGDGLFERPLPRLAPEFEAMGPTTPEEPIGEIPAGTTFRVYKILKHSRIYYGWLETAHSFWRVRWLGAKWMQRRSSETPPR